jgi:hypothetical protein
MIIPISTHSQRKSCDYVTTLKNYDIATLTISDTVTSNKRAILKYYVTTFKSVSCTCKVPACQIHEYVYAVLFYCST